VAPRSQGPSAKTKLLDAAVSVIRTKGYAATTVDDLCAAAGVTKGAFFHHFKTKDDLAIAAVNHWREATDAMFAAAPYHNHPDPLERVLAYIEFRKTLLQGDVAEFTCLIGTIVQEAYDTNPDIRHACDATISGHAANLVSDIAEAKTAHGIKEAWTPESLALHTQAVLQGAFILAKAKNGPDIAAASIDHLRRYVELLFKLQPQGGRT
jgi:TetR/AcrR family transcriptional regulator, transcriptional repressor for nem operon